MRRPIHPHPVNRHATCCSKTHHLRQGAIQKHQLSHRTTAGNLTSNRDHRTEHPATDTPQKLISPSTTLPQPLAHALATIRQTLVPGGITIHMERGSANISIHHQGACELFQTLSKLAPRPWEASASKNLHNPNHDNMDCEHPAHAREQREASSLHQQMTHCYHEVLHQTLQQQTVPIVCTVASSEGGNVTHLQTLLPQSHVHVVDKIKNRLRRTASLTRQSPSHSINQLSGVWGDVSTASPEQLQLSPNHVGAWFCPFLLPNIASHQSPQISDGGDRGPSEQDLHRALDASGFEVLQDETVTIALAAPERQLASSTGKTAMPPLGNKHIASFRETMLPLLEERKSEIIAALDQQEPEKGQKLWSQMLRDLPTISASCQVRLVVGRKPYEPLAPALFNEGQRV